ncbi:hypothetical protein K1T71_013354 [Dendrolimus kikuchii]|uniref:Uncharacterized protein n=1 Tax=Dendrolimus kikuchii TaxID=765133 RepID=A0ACC1CHT7_9NEOP|nr:hypothetical protein K1T71_013354 [Dendrolimus kikuchii]
MFNVGKKFKFAFAGKATDLTHDSVLWYLKDYEQLESHSNKTDVQLELLFVLERRAETLEFDQLKTVILNSRKIWTPFSTGFNRGVRSSRPRAYSPLWANYTGHVIFTVTYSDKVNCVAELTNWPYDVQSCEAEFGPMFHAKKELKLTFASQAFDLTQDGVLWYLKDYKQLEKHSNKTYAQLKLLFVLERKAETLVMMVIYPAYVLIALTLLSILLEITAGVRFGLACFSLLNHLIFHRHIALLIPRHDYNTPGLLLFYRGSLILTVLCILSTLCLRVLCRKTTPLRGVDILVNLVQSSQVYFSMVV